jgi:hypothetical protein
MGSEVEGSEVKYTTTQKWNLKGMRCVWQKYLPKAKTSLLKINTGDQWQYKMLAVGLSSMTPSFII